MITLTCTIKELSKGKWVVIERTQTGDAEWPGTYKTEKLAERGITLAVMKSGIKRYQWNVESLSP